MFVYHDLHTWHKVFSRQSESEGGTGHDPIPHILHSCHEVMIHKARDLHVHARHYCAPIQVSSSWLPGARGRGPRIRSDQDRCYDRSIAATASPLKFFATSFVSRSASTRVVKCRPARALLNTTAGHISVDAHRRPTYSHFAPLLHSSNSTLVSCRSK
jgi:hypothetical protein